MKLEFLKQLIKQFGANVKFSELETSVLRKRG